MTDPRRHRFLSAFNGSPVDRPPLWLMRQAGRYLPGYREVRAKHGFWDVCLNPELSTHVALEPLNRFPLDAAIVFSDILVIPQALGLDVTFGTGEGPQFGKPMRTASDLNAWNTKGIAERLKYVPQAVSHLKNRLNGSHGILGFAGAPFTLFAYSVEGQGSDDFRHARVLMHTDKKLALKAMQTLADAATELLLEEAKAGADVVQLFDTWGGLLTLSEYQEFCVPALQRMCQTLSKANAPTLLFVKGATHLLPVLGETGATGFSLDWRIDWRDARRRYPTHVLQGNIDPVLLFAPPDIVSNQTKLLLQATAETTSHKHSVLNLGHGILPKTPLEGVDALCNAVTAGEAAAHG
jgi:uroporphyrinogen decarboxylase